MYMASLTTHCGADQMYVLVNHNKQYGTLPCKYSLGIHLDRSFSFFVHICVLVSQGSNSEGRASFYLKYAKNFECG